MLRKAKPVDFHYSPLTQPVTPFQAQKDICLPVEPDFDEQLDFFTGGMAATAAGSNFSPYIKHESEQVDFFDDYGQSDNQSAHRFGIPIPSRYQPSSAGSFNSPMMAGLNGGPHSIPMTASVPSLAHSFPAGSSGITDDELLDLDINPNLTGPQGDALGQGTDFISSPAASHFDQQPYRNNQIQIQRQRHGQQTQANSFAFQPRVQPATHHRHLSQSVMTAPTGNLGNSYHAASLVEDLGHPQSDSTHSVPQSLYQIRAASLAGPSVGQLPRHAPFLSGRSMSQVSSRHLKRESSNPQSPLSPHTPAMANHQLEKASLDNLPPQPMLVHNDALKYQAQHMRRLSSSQPWDSKSDSFHGDAPISSPDFQTIVDSNNVASLNTTSPFPFSETRNFMMDTNESTKKELPPGVANQSQEAKRKRRRESHNLVERRRRDNINERIQELSTLVPQHRLEDDKIRKALLNHAPLSPILDPTRSTSAAEFGPADVEEMSGSNSASLRHRRNTSVSMSQLLPSSLFGIDDKDKAPNKGDILNGSVGWMRDLMWALQQKYQREDELRELFASLGRPWPYSESEDDMRMRSELIDISTSPAAGKADLFTTGYSRGIDSGLVVPGFTDAVGKDQALPVSNVEEESKTMRDESFPRMDGSMSVLDFPSNDVNSSTPMNGMNGMNAGTRMNHTSGSHDPIDRDSGHARQMDQLLQHRQEINGMPHDSSIWSSVFGKDGFSGSNEFASMDMG